MNDEYKAIILIIIGMYLLITALPILAEKENSVSHVVNNYSYLFIRNCLDTIKFSEKGCADSNATHCVFMKVDGKEISGEDFCKFVEEKGK